MWKHWLHLSCLRDPKCKGCYFALWLLLGLLPVDGEPAGIFVNYNFFLLFGLYLIRIWLFSIMVLVIVEGQGQNSNWWVKACCLSRWFTIKNSSMLVLVVV